MWFKKKCICNKKKEIVYTEVITTMQGDIKIHYCAECYSIKLKDDLQRQEMNKVLFNKEQEEREKQYKYEWLKREVEIKELEKKAKELGIISQ